MRREQGLTLIELVVTVAIIGILASAAISTYEAYRKRTYEAIAISFMRSWVAAQEEFRQRKGYYADADEILGEVGMKILVVPRNVPYNFHIDSDNRQTESWYGRATPKTGGLRHFYVNQTGVVVGSTDGPPNP